MTCFCSKLAKTATKDRTFHEPNAKKIDQYQTLPQAMNCMKSQTSYQISVESSSFLTPFSERGARIKRKHY